jgi:hypothetical protein
MGLMFVDPPADGLAQARRALQPGGRLAIAVWAGPEHNPWLTIVGMSAMGAGLPVELPIGPGGPFSLADPVALQAMAVDAGFADVVVDVVDLAMHFADAAAHVAVSGALAPALGPVLAEATAEQLDAVQAMVAEADEPYADSDGVHVPGRALVLGGRAPT